VLSLSAPNDADTRVGTHNIATDSSDPIYREIKRLDITLKARLVEERHDERSQTTINMQTDICLLGKFTQSRDWVLVNQYIATPRFRICGERTTAPSGKFGADPTIMIVLMFLFISADRSAGQTVRTYTARAIRLTSALRLAMSTGITCSLILKYSHAFQKAA
jgi:hypothetical protein